MTLKFTPNIKSVSNLRHSRFGVLIWFVIFFLPLLNACSQKEPQETSLTTVGILLFGDSRQPQVKGFIDEMAQAGFIEGKSIRYVIRNAKNNRNKLGPMLDELVAEAPQLLIATGGLEADTMKMSVKIKHIPVLVLSVNAIIERGLVKSRNQNDWEVTGVDNLAAEVSGKRVQLIQDMLPHTERILILYYPNIAPSRIGVVVAKKVAKKLEIEIDARKVNSREEIRAVMDSLRPGDYDAMLAVPNAPIDNALKDLILPTTNRLNLPVFTYSKTLAELGAFASYGADFYELGRQSARLAQKILSGIEAKHIPFETPKRFIYSVNKDVQGELGIELNALAQIQVNNFIVNRQ